uniref:Uncharacterized protein n=1 Tax=Panagrolaimus sp. PS1159 TaxID=55785 RepID=A0AC35GH52_9BILA
MEIIVFCNSFFLGEAQGGNAGAVSQQRQVSRSRSAGPDTISNSGKPGASRMKTINRFSNFVKSGMESYILTQSKMASEPGERHEVIVCVISIL